MGSRFRGNDDTPSLATPEQSLLLPVPLPLALVRALVVLQLAARERDLELDAPFRVVQVERDERVAALLDLADQAADFFRMHEELARARRVGHEVGRHGG